MPETKEKILSVHPSKINWTWKKLVTYFTEGSSLMTEFWLMGLIHQYVRRTTFFGGNVNKPHVGTFVAFIYFYYHIAMFLGGILGLMIGLQNRFVLITSLYFFGLIIATFVQGFGSSGYFCIGLRVILGVCSGIRPVMCLMRSQIDQQKVTRQTEFGYDTTNLKLTKISMKMIELIEYSLSFGTILLATLVYVHHQNLNNQNIYWPTIVMTVILIILAIMFYATFGFREIKIYSENTNLEVKNYVQFAPYEPISIKRQNHQDNIQDRHKFFDFIVESEPNKTDDITELFNVKRYMWDYILGAELFRAVRVCDLLYMLLTIQCHPYYGGPYMEWKLTVFLMIFAGLLASLVVSFGIAVIITHDNALEYMTMTSVISLFIYPIGALVVYSQSYKNKYRYLWFFILEFLKFLVHFSVEEGFFEVLNDACGTQTRSQKQKQQKKKKQKEEDKKKEDMKRKEMEARGETYVPPQQEDEQEEDEPMGDNADEKYRALSHLASNLLRAMIFVTSGLGLTFFTKDIKMSHLKPYNFFIGFTLIALWFIGCFILFERAKANKNRNK